MHRVQESKIRLIPIFAYCPMLKSLEIDNIYPSCQIVEESSEDCAKFIDFTISGLRRLSIRGMVIERESLNAIIMRCPDLRTLRLLDIAQRSIDTTSFYRQTFYPFVIDQCPQLQEFHFSMAHELCTREIATVMINNIAPQVESSPTLLPSSNSQNQTFLRNTTANGLNINTVSILETDIRLDTSSIYFSPFLHSHYSNIITSLHIIPSSESVTPRYPIYVEEVLHEFLCSAPSLLILNAQSVTYKGEYFNDYYDSEATEAEGNHATRTPILEGDSTVVHNEAPRRTWACRNLQKLRIKLTPAYDDKPHIKNSRITFGYISKMCPDLRELAIEQPKLSFKLNGGFCLLSRLKKLERLIIKTPDITSLKMRDIEWMTLPPPPPPRAKNEKKSRFKTFFDSRPCKSFFSWKDNILANLLRGSRGSSRDPMTDVGGCLKQLARDTDDGFGCWPNLEYLGIFIALEHKGKVIPSCRIAFGMVAKVRPDLEISCSEDDWLKLSKNDAVFLRR
ncbi:hypothetical protein BGZ76_010925 [Entomortierella beljakovae]|nr:hypothetical protein BGZ76_010925 [Entomortierella beljakovae]